MCCQNRSLYDRLVKHRAGSALPVRDDGTRPSSIHITTSPINVFGLVTDDLRYWLPYIISSLSANRIGDVDSSLPAFQAAISHHKQVLLLFNAAGQMTVSKMCVILGQSCSSVFARRLCGFMAISSADSHQFGNNG
jgi:hypothetical protein